MKGELTFETIIVFILVLATLIIVLGYIYFYSGFGQGLTTLPVRG